MTIQLGFSFLAGLLTTLSPCVLPVLPMLLGSAVQKNKKAPLLMIIGLAISFTIVGYTISRFGSLFGLDGDQIRYASAVLLILSSSFFFSKSLQDFVSVRMSKFASFGSSASSGLKEESAWGSLMIGVLLGIIWSPCVGPTLGVAVSLASQSGASSQALLTMTVYSVGAGLPMLAIAYGLRTVFINKRKTIMSFAENSKKVFGYVLVISGVLILTSLDKVIETYLLSNLPEAWVNLITKF